MLYATLKVIIGSGLRLHFRRIETAGWHRLEKKQPTIIIANHTNALTDPLLLGILLQRRIHFYVRGDVFEHKLARALFTHLGMLPIYRLQDGREKLSQNEASNEQALRMLQQGGALLIFAEGSSDEHKVLRPVKKGPFRLAVAAAKLLPEPPVILPLGINYLEPEKPDTTAWLLAGEQLAWPHNWRELPEARLSLELMKNAEQALAPLTLQAGDTLRAALAETLLLLDKTAGLHKNGFFNFNSAQTLMKRLAALPDQDYYQLREQVIAYQQCLNELKLEEVAFKPQADAETWPATFLGAPIWVAGLLFHAPVFALARRIVRKKVTTRDFISSIHVLAVTFLNIIWYLCWLLVFSLVWDIAEGFLLLLALAASGVISYTILLPAVRQWRQQQRLHRLCKRRKEPVTRLLSLRQALIAWLHETD